MCPRLLCTDTAITNQHSALTPTQPWSWILRLHVLTILSQYLPNRRRLCDEPNQAHPPVAPATFERKHP